MSDWLCIDPYFYQFLEFCVLLQNWEQVILDRYNNYYYEQPTQNTITTADDLIPNLEFSEMKLALKETREMFNYTIAYVFEFVHQVEQFKSPHPATS